jgi:membrane protease YdiL (CAAX protease family)
MAPPVTSLAPALAARTAARSLVAWRLVELLAIFVALPLLVRLRVLPGPRLLVLAGVTGAAVALLARDRFYDLSTLWSGRLRPALPGILARAALAAVVILALAAWLAPDRILALPLRQPGIWLAGLLLYPLLSAFPQEVLYRAFFFRRYAIIFTEPSSMVAASGVAFAMLHLVYPNLVAPLLSLPAGLILAWRYQRGDGMGPAWLEHSLYGLLLFSLGLGGFFYDGRG